MRRHRLRINARANSIPALDVMRLPSLESLTERQVSVLVILFGLLLYIPFAGVLRAVGSVGDALLPRSRAR